MMESDSYNVLIVGTALIPTGGAGLQVDEDRLNSSFLSFSDIFACVLLSFGTYLHNKAFSNSHTVSVVYIVTYPCRTTQNKYLSEFITAESKQNHS